MSVSEQNIQDYLTHIGNKYAEFHDRMGFTSEANQIQKFRDYLRTTDGKSYIKVIKEGSVHSFIVKADNGKFKAGDVLKAASFNAPAKNFKRGNVVTGDLDNIDWSM
jgi:adenine deaminase